MWHEIYGLEPYTDPEAPSVFFGVYYNEDIHAIRNHRGSAIVRWCGRDALKWLGGSLISIDKGKPIRHVTPLPAVKIELEKRGLDFCQIIPLSYFPGREPDPKPAGKSIYCYYDFGSGCSEIKPLNKEIEEKYNVIYPPRQKDRCTLMEWLGGAKENFYDVFAGLMLSDFAKGGASIVELGLMGVPCITNVLNLPNTIPWSGACDVMETLHQLEDRIGKKDVAMANAVYEKLDKKHKWLYL